MKKILLPFVLFISFGLLACGSDEEKNLRKSGIPAEKIKVGFIYSGAISDKGYTYTHDQARLKMAKELGVETVIVENVYGDVRAEFIATSLIKQGCNVIYATSFEYMEDLASVAEKNPNVFFGHATGYMQLSNMSTYMGRVYEARYLAGIVAGLNTKSNKIGYVAAMPVAEVTRGINAFALGVKSVNTDAIIEIEWTGAWESPAKEKELALKLIDKGADIIAQHTNTHMPQVAAQERGVLAIGYSNSTRELLPDTYITAPLFNWATYYVDDVSKIINGTWKSRAYYEGLDANMVALDPINEALVSKETVEKVEKAKKEIMENGFKIFSGPIYDNKGKLRVEKGKSMNADEIQSMVFFIDNVVNNK